MKLEGNVFKIFAAAGVFFAFSFLGVVSARAQDGKAVFEKNKCFVCHGNKGEGKIGKKLSKTKLSEDELKKVIVDGRKAKKGASMPSFKGKIKGKDLDALAKFIKSL